MSAAAHVAAAAAPRPRLAIVATHPIQYHVPWYRALAAEPRLDVRVLFAMLPDAAAQGTGFGRDVVWDIDLLDGYSWEVLLNRRKRPRLDGFFASSAPAHDALRRLRPHAILLTGWQQWPLLQALAAARRLGIPTIVRGESSALARRPAWVSLLHSVLLRRIRAFLAIGSANRAFYQRAGVADEAIVDCPYFVDNDRFAAQAEKLAPMRAELRSAWNIAGNVTTFAFVGKFQRKKRPLDLLQAAATARTGGAPLHVLMVGAGELDAELRAFAARERLPVTFTGFMNQSEVARAYVAADVLVLPSDAGETWGLVVNEAMACGRPAIVSDRVGCGLDLIVEAQTGYRYPCGDPQALAALLQRCAAGADALPEMGHRARRRVMEQFSVQRAVGATLQAVSLVTH